MNSVVELCLTACEWLLSHSTDCSVQSADSPSDLQPETFQECCLDPVAEPCAHSGDWLPASLASHILSLPFTPVFLSGPDCLSQV